LSFAARCDAAGDRKQFKKADGFTMWRRISLDGNQAECQNTEWFATPQTPMSRLGQIAKYSTWA
jgi:hypothetical protein